MSYYNNILIGIQLNIMTSKLLVTQEVYDFLDMHITFLAKKGMIPRFVYREHNGKSYRAGINGRPRVVHKQNRIEITVEPAFKNLIASIMKREQVNLYNAIYLAVVELSFTPE
jgi:hypothetical protein